MCNVRSHPFAESLLARVGKELLWRLLQVPGRQAGETCTQRMPHTIARFAHDLSRDEFVGRGKTAHCSYVVLHEADNSTEAAPTAVGAAPATLAATRTTPKNPRWRRHNDWTATSTHPHS
jgi:hypothetical protein